MSTAEYDDGKVQLHAGDCLDVLRGMPDASVHAVVTDPPYGLSDHKPEHVTAALTAWISGDREHVPNGKGFMGRDWDSFVPPPAVWDECLRVLKPGGHLLVFAAPRTMDLMGLSIRLAGFEIRDSIGAALMAWVQGAGMPKGQNVSKAIDATLLHGGANSRRLKASNAEREVLGPKLSPDGKPASARRVHSASNNGIMGEQAAVNPDVNNETAPATPEAAQWEGWNTSLRPSWEPIIVARKPLAGKTVAANVMEHGTGALNVDATRTSTENDRPNPHGRGGLFTFDGFTTVEQLVAAAANGEQTPKGRDAAATLTRFREWQAGRAEHKPTTDQGRWPSNVVLVHSPLCAESACEDGCPVAEMDRQSGITKDGVAVQRNGGGQKIGGQGIYSGSAGLTRDDQGYGGEGGASRYFPTFKYQAKAPASERPKIDGKGWPTVKPLALMRWLVRLVTPPGGTVLEPFSGSGTTVEAAMLEGFHVVGIERDEFAVQLTMQRIERAHQAITERVEATGKANRPTPAPTKPKRNPTPAPDVDPATQDMLPFEVA